MNTRHEHLWVGIDVGKGHHWAVAINSAGEAVFSRKIPNDETEILKLIAAACEAADQVKWPLTCGGRPRRCCWFCLPHTASTSPTSRAGA